MVSSLWKSFLHVSASRLHIMFGGKIGKPGLEPETHLRFVCWLAPAALPVKLHTYNRPLTVSTRIYRAMRDTIRFVLPLLLSGLGGFFAFFSVCRKHREKPTWNTMFQAIWLAYKTALFHFRQILLLRFFYWNKNVYIELKRYHTFIPIPAHRNRTCHFCPHIKVRMSVSPLKPTPEPIREEKVIGPWLQPSRNCAGWDLHSAWPETCRPLRVTLSCTQLLRCLIHWWIRTTAPV